MTQLALNFAETVESRYARFISSNPWVLDELCRLALNRKQRGFKTYGIASLVERLRWDHERPTKGDDWKINNDYRAWLARDVMEREPRLAGFFRTRRSAADREGR